jgi:hypothetical protein
MFKRFGLDGKILAVNADNATSNDTQTIKLDALDNSFDKENRVRCFNHTLQLSVKALLKPFNTALTGMAGDDDDVAVYQDNIGQTILEDDEEDGDGDADENEDEDEDTGDTGKDLQDDEIDELEELNEEDREQILEETAAVRTTVTKVRFAKQIIFVFSPTNYLIVYRSDNYHLPSFTPQPSLSPLGDVSAVSSISSSDSFPAMS